MIIDIDISRALWSATSRAHTLASVLADRTVDTDPQLDEDRFFSTEESVGFVTCPENELMPTLTTRYDLELAVSRRTKRDATEINRYWVNKPFALVIVLESESTNERRYCIVEPHLTPVETEIYKTLRNAIQANLDEHEDDISEEDRRKLVHSGVTKGLETIGLVSSRGQHSEGGIGTRIHKVIRALIPSTNRLDGIQGFRYPIEPDPDIEFDELNDLPRRNAYVPATKEYQWLSRSIERIRYYILRDLLGYGPIDGPKHDPNVEDISCNGADQPVFVYHTEYRQLETNISYEEAELERFIDRFATDYGPGFDRHRYRTSFDLPDGSQVELTRDGYVAPSGPSFTVRQFKDIPFTPVDLINWQIFSLDQMALLWLAIENRKSLLIAGGTGSGKATTLNALGLFIPGNQKIVSIEDVRGLELPHRNWTKQVATPKHAANDSEGSQPTDLLKAAVQHRPHYLLLSELRGLTAQTYFQLLSTGQPAITTFHADSIHELLHKLTTDPSNVSKSAMTGLNLISVQTQTRVGGRKVRRTRTLAELGGYDPDTDDLSVRSLFEWRPESDEFVSTATPTLLDEIQFERGWSRERRQEELDQRRIILAALIAEKLNSYPEVALTLQLFMRRQELVLRWIANGSLAERLQQIRSADGIGIDVAVNPEKEALVPRPEPPDSLLQAAEQLLEDHRGLLSTFASESADDPGTGFNPPDDSLPAFLEEFSHDSGVDVSNPIDDDAGDWFTSNPS